MMTLSFTNMYAPRCAPLMSLTMLCHYFRHHYTPALPMRARALLSRVRCARADAADNSHSSRLTAPPNATRHRSFIKKIVARLRRVNYRRQTYAYLRHLSNAKLRRFAHHHLRRRATRQQTYALMRHDDTPSHYCSCCLPTCRLHANIIELIRARHLLSSSINLVSCRSSPHAWSESAAIHARLSSYVVHHHVISSFRSFAYRHVYATGASRHVIPFCHAIIVIPRRRRHAFVCSFTTRWLLCSRAFVCFVARYHAAAAPLSRRRQLSLGHAATPYLPPLITMPSVMPSMPTMPTSRLRSMPVAHTVTLGRH